MSQQITTFVLGLNDRQSEEQLNKFLRGHRVLTIDKVFDAGNWHICVVWQISQAEVYSSNRQKAERVDYKELLEPETFALFAKLRELRKSLATNERLPAYAVMTDKQLSEVAKARCQTLAELGRVDGLGEARLKKYGEPFLECLKSHEEQ